MREHEECVENTCNQYSSYCNALVLTASFTCKQITARTSTHFRKLNFGQFNFYKLSHKVFKGTRCAYDGHKLHLHQANPFDVNEMRRYLYQMPSIYPLCQLSLSEACHKLTL